MTALSTKIAVDLITNEVWYIIKNKTYTYIFVKRIHMCIYCLMHTDAYIYEKKLKKQNTQKVNEFIMKVDFEHFGFNKLL